MFAPVATPRLRLGLPRACLRPRRSLHWNVVRCSARPNAAPSLATRLTQRDRAESVALWDALDLASVAGTVTGATLVVLGYDVLFATLPIGLPIFSLFIGIQRERRRLKARDVMDEMIMDDIQRQKEALENVQSKIGSVATKIDALLSGKVMNFESKLDRIEATMISTSKNVKELSGGLKNLPGIMKRISELQQQTVIYAVSAEFRSLFEKWGTTQLQSIGDVSERLKYVEESIDKLGSYDLRSASSYDLPGASTIEVAANAPDSTPSSVLHDLKDVIQKEISSVLKQLKDNQVDMMQSLRDVKINPVPQADYADFESQLKRIEEVLGGLPQQLGESFRTETEGIDLKGTFLAQFNAISAVVHNLEIAIEELKKAATGQETSTELEMLEKKWLELRGMMNRLGAHITGVNDRMDKIIHPSNTETEVEPEVEPEIESPPAEFLEFQETSAVPVTSTNGTSGGWDVVESVEEAAFAEPIGEADDGFGEEEEVEVPVEENGSHLEASPRPVQDVVSKIGNAKVGLELLKKGRLALAKDYGEASRYLVDALAEFSSILEIDPVNVQCLGNCGNTLLALGELKFRMAQDLEGDSVDASPALQQEAQEFLTLAGRRFKALLEIKPEDKRAYMNWAKALCMRAQLSAEPPLKMQLYDAAIVKYEQILSFEAESAEAMYFCGVALKESSQVPMGSPMELRNRLNQAVVYFESVSRVAPSSPLQFEAFQQIQECRQLAGSPALI